MTEDANEQRFADRVLYKFAKKEESTFVDSSCDPGEARTHDPLIKSQLLYQLSYGVMCCFKHGAKVLLFDKSANFLNSFFAKKNIIFFKLLCDAGQTH